MNSSSTILLASVAALCLCAATSPGSQQLQKRTPQGSQGLARVETNTDGAFDAEQWKQKLGANDLDQRERDFDELVLRAERAPAARDALRSWSHSDQRELAWSARMALPSMASLTLKPSSARYRRSSVRMRGSSSTTRTCSGSLIRGPKLNCESAKTNHFDPVTKRHISPPKDIKSRGFWHQPVTWLL